MEVDEEQGINMTKLMLTARNVRAMYERVYTDELTLVDVLCKTAVQLLEHCQDAKNGWDFNQERSPEVAELVNVFFPNHGFDIPWKVSHANVCTYRKLIIFGLRPYVVNGECFLALLKWFGLIASVYIGSDEALVKLLAENRERWLMGLWTPAQSVYHENGVRINYLPSRAEIDDLLFKVGNMSLTA